VIDFLGPRDLLLVLDNCEHLLAATVELTDRLLRVLPRLTLVATSREALRVPGEVVFRVPSLGIPDPEVEHDPHELLGYEAVRLFVERATAAAPGFVLDADSAADVARICFRLDGLPLALELAAGRMGALGPAAIAERLGDRFRVLRTASRASPTRQQTLSATLQWSHDLLDARERTLFRRLAAFAGGFDLQAVEAVCSGDDLESAGVADLVARLVEKSLVTVDDGTSRERRYRLLETVRLYARERLEEAGESGAFIRRHADWALELAEREHGAPALDRDAANLRAALDALRAAAPQDALRMALALWPFWMRRIDLQEAQRRLQEALAAAPSRTPLRAQALLAASGVDFRSGELTRGYALAEESLAVAEEIDDARAQWRALQFLGEFGVAADAADVAMPWLERGLALARHEGFAAGEAIGVYSLGVACWLLGYLQRAEDLFARSLELLEPLAGSPERITSPLNIVEVRTSRPGDRPGIPVVLEDTLQPFAEITCESAIAYVLANQAGIVRARGDLARARQLLDASGARFEQAGDDPGRAAVLVRRAYLELSQGRVPEARAGLEAALEIRRAQRDRRGIGLALAGLGLIETAAGDHDTAERHLAEAREIFRRAGDRWGLASTLWRIADLAFARERLDEAQAALDEALAVLSPTQRLRWIANTLAGQAEVALLRAEREQARTLLAEALALYTARNDRRGVADVEDRLRDVAKDPLRAGKAAPDTT
jgi:predicted ATPase